MMIDKKSSKNWALAIFEIYKEKKQIDLLEKELIDLFLLLNDNENYISLIGASSLSIDQKKNIIKEAFQKHLSKDLFNAINLMIDKNATFLLLNIIKELSILIDELNNSKHGIIYSVILLTTEQIKQIETKVEKMLKIKVKLINRINKNILGGIKISINNVVIDYSLKNQLQELKETINITL